MNDATQFFSGGYQIERSLRFNSSDSAYLSRTPASAGNRKTWTWAGWVKKTAVGSGTEAHLIRAGTTSSTAFRFSPTDNIQFYIYNGGFISLLVTSAVFRDPSAWFHVLVALDTTQATASDRVKIYVNGVRETSFSNYIYPSQNYEGYINNTDAHAIGAEPTPSEFLNGYLADIHFIDGQALTPSDFTETDATTGQLIPKEYTGSYGTNGFHLKFSDNSAATATTLGKDTSGNGNNWTPNNLSVTAGSGNDSLVDTPTSYGTDTGAGGEVRGNYATLNPLDGSPTGISNGNLDAASANAYPTIIPGSGQWYYEVNGTGYQWDGTRANWTPRAGSYNFGQRAWSSSAPSGYKALCATNLSNTTITTSGTYTGNGAADGPFVYLNGVPTAMTVNGNAVTFGTEADKLSNGFKVRTASTIYNQNAATYSYSITSTGDPFKRARAQANP